MKKLRICFILSSVIIFLVEVYIALFVSDSFIRPYFGDVLVTFLLCCIVRSIYPVLESYSLKNKSVWLLPLGVFIFSVFIEICQLFHYVDLLGLGHIKFFRIVMGTGFAFEDIWCYLAGCVTFVIFEYVLVKKMK